MSCTGSQEWIVMLAQLLENEKKDTRVWLRAEMDRLVDPMLESFFNRLATKLTNGLRQFESAGAGDSAHAAVLSFANQSTNAPQSSSTFIIQPSSLVLPSNTLYISSLNPTSFYLNPQYVQSQFTSSPVPPPPGSITNAQIALPNEPITNIQSRDPINAIETTNEKESNHEGHLPQSLSLAPNVVNESQSNQLNCDKDEEDDDCVIIGPIDQDDDNDNIELFKDEEYEDEESDQPLKKTKVDTIAQSEVHNEHCFTNETQSNLVTNNQDKQCNTVHLQCTEPNCWDTFKPHLHNQHMLEKHHLAPHRCLVKNCRQSFNHNRTLSKHIKQHYQHTTQLQCAKCVKNFPKYNRLYAHNLNFHQIGQFECAVPSCTFRGEYRNKVYNHYKLEHKRPLNCPQSDCNFQTPDPGLLNNHQQIHSGIKPYRCKWPRCKYSAAKKGQVMAHIRLHIARMRALQFSAE